MLSKQEILQRIQDLLNKYKNEQAEILADTMFYSWDDFHEGQQHGEDIAHDKVIADLEALLKESE